jgi:hypothetical protein
MKLNRRHFLQALGLGAALPAATLAAAPNRLRVLALAPKKFSRTFLQGLSNPNLEVQFVYAGATTHSAAQAVAQKLETQTFDVLVSLGDGFAETLRPVLEQHSLPAICNEFGAKVAPLEQSAFITINSLNLWQSEWALGAHVASQRKHNIGRGNTAVLLCSLREAGYDLPFAFQSGFESAGGKLLQTLFLELDNQAAILEQLQTLRPAHLHVIASDMADLEWLRSARVPLSASALTPLDATTAFSNQHGDPVRLLAEQSVAMLEQAVQFEHGLLRGLRQAKPQPALELRKNGLRRSLKPVSEMHPQLGALRGGLRSGYTNTYLV